MGHPGVYLLQAPSAPKPPLMSGPRRHNSWPQLGSLLCISVLSLAQENVYLVPYFLYVYQVFYPFIFYQVLSFYLLQRGFAKA